MRIARMKGGFYGLKVTQISFILIGFVCVAVLGLAWTNTSILTSIKLPQNYVLHIAPGQGSNGKSAPEGKSYPELLKKNSSIVERISPVDGLANKHGIPPSVHGENGTKILENMNNSKGERENVVPGSLSSATKTADSSAKVEYSKDSANSKGERENVVPGSLSSATKTTDSSAEVEYSKDSVNSTTRQDCNFSKGKWIMDESRPLYSGFGCKQWLSSMWACRLTQRKDFEYEKLRWQPKDCEMDDFTRPKFFRKMQNKTLAFVGDSLGRQQFQSLMCMITAGEDRPDVLDVGKEYGLIKAHGATRPDGWAYRFPSTNTTILYYWSASLCDLEPIDVSNPATGVAMHLDRPPAFLQRFLHRFDVLVLNTGHHWNRGKLNTNRWIMHVGGVANINRKIAEIGGAKNFTVYSTVGWVNSQLAKYPCLKAFYRSISPRHFFNGDWNTGGTCDNTTPLAGGKEVVDGESIDPLASGAVKGTGVKLLDITALSQLRDEGHISRYSIKATPGVQDCLHWCLPGVPDTWNEILFAQL